MQRLKETGDVAAYAKELTNFTKAFTDPIIRMTFVNEPDRNSVIADLYSRIEARLAADPSDYAFDFIEVATLFTRL